MNEQTSRNNIDIQNSIRRWVNIDNEYKKLYSQISLLREEKHAIE
jgi:hypothetical protein